MENGLPEKPRIKWIDVAKGTCMIAVIAGHIGVIEISDVVFSFHLAVFFVLSGYTLKPAALDRQYLNKKFKSLMLPYFITCFCVMIMDILTQLFQGNTSVNAVTGVISTELIRSFTASGDITSIGMVETGTKIGAIWFLPALFFAIIFVQLLLKYIPQERTQFIAGVMIALIAIISARFIWLPFSIQSAMMATPFLLLGYELKLKPDTLNKLNGKNCFFAFLVFLVCFFLGRTRIVFVNAQMRDVVIALIAGISMGMVVLYFARALENVRLLAWIGRNSLLFLCVHLFTIDSLQYWIDLCMERFSIVNNAFSNFCFYFIIAVAGVGIINMLRRLIRKSKNDDTIIEVQEDKDNTDNSRNELIDIAKGMLIVLMLAGTFGDLEIRFSMILFSFYAVTFVFFSGYFFSPDSCKNIGESIRHVLLTLGVPYVLFSVLYLLFHGIRTKSIQAILFGLSGTEVLLSGQNVIGYAGFLLMLLLVRLGYLLLQRYLPNEYWVLGICLALSILGFWLGQQGYWLPWSLDLALYTMIFYHLGYCFRKYHLLEYFRDNYITYFLLSVVWAYMIYSGSMNLAERQYSSYGMVILGAVSAAILLYQCSSYLVNVLPGFLSRLLQILGQSTLCILIIQTLFGQYFNELVSIWFTEGYIYYMVASIGLQVIAGMLASMAISFVRDKIVLTKA